MQAWQLHASAVPYTWQAEDALTAIAPLTGHTPVEILLHNKLADPTSLQPGMTVSLPCFEARYRLEAGDSLAWLAAAFAYSGVAELAALNGVADPATLAAGSDVRLPGWHFFSARAGDSLEQIDVMFDLPPGSSRPVGRAHHPDPRLPYESETIAVPTASFAQRHRPSGAERSI
jgi:LysM repeat protein